MAKYSQSSNNNGLSGDLVGVISTFCILFCMIVTVLGIKFKWFKHRMNLEQTALQSANNINNNNNRINNDGNRFRSTSEKRSSLTTVQCAGVFRKLDDDEIPIHRAQTLPPIRIKNSSRQQLNFLPSNVNNQNNSTQNLIQQNNQQILVPDKREIFKNMKFNKFPSNTDLVPHVENTEQKPIKKSRRDQSPKKNSSPNKINSPKKQQSSPTNRSKSPQKNRSNESESVNKYSNENRIKKSTKTTNFLKLDIQATKNINNVVNSRQIEKPKEERNVKFVDDTPEQINQRLPRQCLETPLNDDDEKNLKHISTRRATGFVRPTKEEIEELENFDNIIKEIDQDQQYPGILKENNGRVVFKIDGLSDNEDEINQIKTIPIPEPRKSLEKQLENDVNNEESINLMPLASLNGVESNNNNNNNDNEIDSWSAVRQHRNLTQEMAKHHQAIRDAAQIKSAKRQLKNPLAYDLDVNQKSSHLKLVDQKDNQTNDYNSSSHHFNSNQQRLSNNSTEA